MANKLTDKQKRFCEEFIIDLNATKAAERAGYSAKTAYSQGQRLLKNVEVQKLIHELKAVRSAETKIDANFVLTEAAEVYKRCMQKEPVLDKEGAPTGEWKFKEMGALKALELIGKHTNIQAFNEKQTTEVTVKADVPLSELLTGGSKR